MQRSRGFALLTVILIAIGVSAFAMLVLRAAGLDTLSAYSQRRAEDVFYSAENGIQWAIGELHTAYPPGAKDITEVLSRLGVGNRADINAGDEACPSADCRFFVAYLSDGSIDATGDRYVRITDAGGRRMGNNRVHAAIRRPSPDDLEPNTLRIRVIAWNGNSTTPIQSTGPIRAIEADVALE